MLEAVAPVACAGGIGEGAGWKRASGPASQFVERYEMSRGGVSGALATGWAQGVRGGQKAWFSAVFRALGAVLSNSCVFRTSPEGPQLFPEGPRFFPVPSGKNRETTGTFPETTGKNREGAGSFPEGTGNNPETPRSFPETTGLFPETTGKNRGPSGKGCGPVREASLGPLVGCGTADTSSVRSGATCGTSGRPWWFWHVGA